ncbi:sigma factor-like helix-turn-helix DNA-binding protein [Demequina capsici]|uniref:Sigma factor-like helix-turn-helix DNA-binding protein n=1 Tax=Demequina capsici TaxID=3075620 RepID=A0AA96FA23_9MICO|nr:sigma factor-like helix-turn-helix DNA-binding protein [Demequina sp. OYTSA14]WNM24851.1 sigma factor-like helix-turn-helix DNA-binding protein [Demequina sp. OYTSA14]
MFAQSLPRLSGYAYALTGSHAAAEDLVTAAMLRVLTFHLRPLRPAAAEARAMREIRRLHLAGPRRQARWSVATERIRAEDGERRATRSAAAPAERAASAPAASSTPEQPDPSIFAPPRHALRDDGGETARVRDAEGNAADEARQVPHEGPVRSRAVAPPPPRLPESRTSTPFAQALDALSPVVRTAAAMRHIEGLDVASVARSMKVSERTVEIWWEEARAVLAPVLGVDSERELDVVRVKGAGS